MFQLKLINLTFTQRIVRWTYFTQTKLFGIILLIGACFFFLQEIFMYRKTRKPFHRLYSLCFLFIIITFIGMFLVIIKLWTPWSIQVLVVICIMIPSIILAVSFLIRGMKAQRLLKKNKYSR